MDCAVGGYVASSADAAGLVLQECNLYQLMKTCHGLLPESLVREWCATIFQGLAYIHEKGYFHRDLKPGALFCNTFANPITLADKCSSVKDSPTESVLFSGPCTIIAALMLSWSQQSQWLLRLICFCRESSGEAWRDQDS